jgi:hypothetical protein
MTSTGPQDIAGDSHAAAPIGRASSGRLLLRRDFDPTVPNVARVYDHLLGGKDNFAADRKAAARLLEAVPGAAVAAQENRAFLGRAVRFLAEEAGICQFLDLGAGMCASYCVPFKWLYGFGAWRRVRGRLPRFRAGRGWPSRGWGRGGRAVVRC